MNIDGLACLTKIPSKPESTITPLPHMFVIKDLVVDMTNFYNHYKKIKPWLKRKNPPPVVGKEILQSKKDRAKLDGMYECIHNFPFSSFFFLLFILSLSLLPSSSSLNLGFSQTQICLPFPIILVSFIALGRALFVDGHLSSFIYGNKKRISIFSTGQSQIFLFVMEKANFCIPKYLISYDCGMKMHVYFHHRVCTRAKVPQVCFEIPVLGQRDCNVGYEIGNRKHIQGLAPSREA
ncbi:hypothetical protein SLEP1_g4366 [Rubroshorea leprosula]|uniref:Uncharacterized protein n=1 Tax=Rubroshorea leprosula TaxID=152421 RepID=A0AAV5HUG2_9ROSI|nr:hypothetical protein SLEP1_g4366 [Rubroshorea leprosula]